jgi:pimeloyl-ACP methyl ester carboxylesterase
MTGADDLRTVDVDGRRVAFRQAGSGPVLVLLHGAVCDSRVWEDQLRLLAARTTVVAWDAPGCGGSSDPPEDWRLPEFAACLGAFLDAIGAGPAPVLGHSFGSCLALELARQRPDLVKSLILVGGYAGWAGSLPPGEVERRLQFALDAAARLPGVFEPTAMPGLFSERMPEAGARLLASTMRDIRPAATRAMARALAEADLRPVLRAITVPTMLLHGDADLRSDDRVARALHDAIPGSRLAVLPGLGHECFLEDPPAVADAVLTFLAAAT